MIVHEHIDVVLAMCGGFAIEADDGLVGTVETPLFPPDGGAPDFLVLRVRDRLSTRRPVLPAALVDGVDPERKVVRVRGTRAQVMKLPEQVPLAI